MDLRLMFNEDAESYDKFRPTYTEEVFSDIIQFSQLDKYKQALEIGIGTGQATLPFLKTGCQVTAIELGNNLAEYSRNKFKQFENLQVLNQDFESAKLDENAYDLVYSASAFHWIPPETGIPKVYKLLKEDGVFVWFANQPGPAKEHLHIQDAFQKVYARHREFFKPLPDLHLVQENAVKKCKQRTKMLEDYGFVDVRDKVYYSSRTFTGEEYATLISTYSDHKAMPEHIRIPFLREIANTIDQLGGKFTLCDMIILSMGRKAGRA